MLKNSRRYKPFKRQEWGNSPGANLVMNCKSLNRETTRRNQEQIKMRNLHFLNKLQSLESEYKTENLLAAHQRREPMVERICKYPLILNREGV